VAARLGRLREQNSAYGFAATFMPSYLVTGGAGFIGSHLAEAIARQGHSVRVADNLSTGKRENLDHIPEVEFLEGDLADFDFAERAVEGMQYVLHQAAIPSVARSVEEPLASHKANVDATLNVLVASRSAGVKRVVYAGSSSVYGDAPALPKGEDMASHPLTPYALQKLVAEQYCVMFTRLFGFETVSLRYFNVFGPRQDPGSPYSGVISRFAVAMLAGQPPTIYGDGEQTRDFTYVANVVDGVMRACAAPDVSGQVINLATGRRISLNGLVRTLNECLGTQLKAIHEEPRIGDIRDSQADVSRAEALLGYQPRVSLDEGLRLTLDWFRTGRPAHVDA